MTETSTAKVVLVAAVLVLSAGVVTAATTDVFTALSNNDDGAVLQTGNGLKVNLTGNTDVYKTTGGLSSSKIQWNTTAGNATFSSTGAGSVTVAKDQLTGTWTNLTAIDAGSTEITVNPADKQAVTVSQEVDTIRFTSMAIDDGTVDFVSGGASGQTEVTITDLPANTELAAMGVESNSVLDVATTDASGTVTFVLPNSEHVVELQTNDGPPTASDVTPTDGHETNQESVTFSVGVDDPDFPEDDVTATLYRKGPTESSFSQEYQTSLDTAGTVSTTLSLEIGGGHDYYWTLEDGYGDTTQTTTRTVFVPDELRIYNVSDPDQRITNSGNAEVTFRTSGDVYTRSTSNGRINLTGLPVTGTIVATVDVDQYYARQTAIYSIFEQQEIYLLKEPYASVYEVRFTLEDRTGGQFENNEPTVTVERALNKSGNPDWVAVGGGRFGVQGYTTFLQQNEEYRLVVRNSLGDQRVFYPYTASASETVPLRVGNVSADPTSDQESYTANFTYINGTTSYVQFAYADEGNRTEEIYVEIYEQGNESNVLLQNTSYSAGPYGTLSVRQQVPSAYENSSWVVHYVAKRDGGANANGQEIVGPRRSVLQQLPVWLMTLISIGSILVVSGLFSQANGALGGIVAAALGGIWWYVDMLPDAVGVGVVALAMVIAGAIFMRTRGAAA